MRTRAQLLIGEADKAASAKGDLEIVSYALTLEYLETDFYKPCWTRA